jgi:hypothetical protein
MDAGNRPPGRTQEFVAALGFGEKWGREVLLDRDGRGRLFLELTTDADHPHSEPAAAYESLLSTLEPGAQVRFLQIFWPDDEPRAAFLRQAADQPDPGTAFTSGLLCDLTGYLSHAPLPYLRRTILEIVMVGEESAESVGGAVEILRSHGLISRLLRPAEVQDLARWVFHPVLE